MHDFVFAIMCKRGHCLIVEMIADEDDDNNIFETVDEDSGRAEDDEEIDEFAEDDKRDEEGLKRRGYTILSSD
jgi:hypothetical protein